MKKIGLLVFSILIISSVIGCNKIDRSNEVFKQENFEYLVSNVKIKAGDKKIILPCKAKELQGMGLFSNEKLENTTIDKYFEVELRDETETSKMTFGFSGLDETVTLDNGIVTDFTIDKYSIIDESIEIFGIKFGKSKADEFDGISLNDTYEDVLKKYGKPDEQTTLDYLKDKISKLPENHIYSLKYTVRTEKDNDFNYNVATIEYKIKKDGTISSIYIDWK